MNILSYKIIIKNYLPECLLLASMEDIAELAFDLQLVGLVENEIVAEPFIVTNKIKQKVEYKFTDLYSLFCFREQVLRHDCITYILS